MHARGARVILACRNLEKTNKAIKNIKNKPPSWITKDEYETSVDELVTYYLDLNSLQSVKQCAKKIIMNETNIDILINNAGVCAHPYEKTIDNNELTLQVNYLDHFLLTLLLLPKMKLSSNCRIINLSSIAHVFGDINFNNINLEILPIMSYSRNKLENILFTKALAHRLKSM